MSSGKYKLKQQGDITFYLLEWLLSKGQEITSVGNVEKKESLCTTGGNINWWGYCGKQYGDFSRN